MAALTGAAQAQRQPPAPPVTDTYFGTAFTDPFRFIENLDDPAVTAWMRAQGDYTRAQFDRIPARAALAERIAAFTGSFQAVNSVQQAGGRSFFQGREPGSDNFDLLVRERNTKSRA